MASSVRKLDRISNLHDSILCHILSYLTTKESVGTSILSTRWQYLWASVPVLDFEEGLTIRSHHNMSRGELSIIFRAFVNRVLLLSDVSSLEKFHLSLENQNTTHPGFDSWVRTAIRRNVVELSLSIVHAYDYARLPTILYTSQTLVVLKVFYNILIDPPASVWLPNLKVLELKSDLSQEYVSSYQRFWSGCPVLEELIMVCIYGRSFNVSVPTLKRLNIEVNDEQADFFFEEQFYEVIIDAPNLKHLEISDFQLTRFTLLNLSSLLVAKAVICFTSFTVDPSQLRRYADLFQLLNGIANAKHLSLSLHGWTWPGSTMSCITNGSSYVTPVFHRLTCLMLDTVDSCGMLYVIIECTPKLEVLHINKICRNVESWSPPRGVPACLQSCLKEIWIKIFDGKKYELKAIAYFLKNAKTLRKMIINCRGVQKEDYHVCKKLSQFPKASTHCLLMLNLVT